jgi:bifunctional DNA-binding transcriptional regulator/antitoxin component of YhaV-PrlF toxin-antitoxin module
MGAKNEETVTETLTIQKTGNAGGRITVPAKFLEESGLEIGDTVIFDGDPDEGRAIFRDPEGVDLWD